jgi:hypothetical protein
MACMKYDTALQRPIRPCCGSSVILEGHRAGAICMCSTAFVQRPVLLQAVAMFTACLPAALGMYHLIVSWIHVSHCHTVALTVCSCADVGCLWIQHP